MKLKAITDNINIYLFVSFDHFGFSSNYKKVGGIHLATSLVYCITE